MEEEKELLYRPSFGPDNEYDSDATFRREPDEYDRSSIYDEEQREPSDIIQDFKQVKDLLPEDVGFIGNVIIDKLIARLHNKFPKGKKPKPDEPVFENPKEIPIVDVNFIPEVEESNIIPSLFSNPKTINLRVEMPKTLVQLIQDDYNKDIIQLQEDYLERLQMIMRQYYQQMLMLVADSGVESIKNLIQEFDGDAVVVPPGNSLEHCRDYIVKSQITRKQKTRLFKKTHTVEETVMHLRAWHAAEAQRERYYSEEYKDSSEYTESHSNALLREERANYDQRYKNALYNTYKYLNSSSLVLNDILDSSVKEAQAKAMLIKNGVDIYATNSLFVKVTNDTIADDVTETGGIVKGTTVGNDKEIPGKRKKIDKVENTENKKIEEKKETKTSGINPEDRVINNLK